LFNKKRLTLIALTLVALLLAGCGLFGPKSFDIVVRIEPPVEGVKIFVDGVHSATTEADGQVELNVKANAKLTAKLEGYTFKQEEQKVTKAGEYVFEIETSPGRKGAIVSVKTVLEDIQVWAGETPFEDLDLPSRVEVVLDDDEEVEVDVDWTAAEEDYDYETAGVYELEGVLVPGEGITNPDNITVEVKVVVEDKEPYDDAKVYLADFFADYEEIGPDVDKLTLPTEIDLGDGVTAKVTWKSSNPEVLDVDGIIHRTAEDVEVTLTGTITIEQAGPEGQAEEDPTVFTITVTVLADPELKAEALVEELEAIDGPKHYSEVADILKLIEDANEAVEAITGNPALRYELRLRVQGVESKVNETLEGHVQAVLDGFGESGNDLKLFDALKAFWDAEEQYREVYWYMVKFMDALEGINHDAIEPGDVDIIQEELIEKAPQVDAERPIVGEIVGAAMRTKLAGNLSQFKDVLQQHADLFQRLNLEDDDDEYTVLNKYADSIVEFAFPPVSATLDDIQLAIDVANREAFEEAVKAAVKSLERSDWTRANTLVAYMADDEAEADDQPKKAAQDALAKLDLVLEVVEAAQNGELGDLYGALEELEVKDVAVDLLIEYQEAVKNALKDGADPALKGREDVAVVIGVLQALVDDKNNELDKFGVTVTQAKVGEALEITVNALNRLGKVKTNFTGALAGVTVTVIGESPISGPDDAQFAGGTAQLSFDVPFEEIGKMSAVLKFSMGAEPVEYAVPFEITVTADPKDGIVTTDAKEYTAGDMIEITVQLLYEEQQDNGEPKYLVTLNGEYPAEITIGDRYYSKLLTFTNGVAVAEVRAEEAGGHPVKVSVEFEAGWVDMTAEETVKIQAGDAVKLDVTGDADGALLEAQDAYGNPVLTYEGPRTIKVTYEPKGIGASTADYEYEIDPDGQVAVVFSEGRTSVLYGDFAADLEAGEYTFTFTVVQDGLTGTTDYPPQTSEDQSS